MDVFDPLSPPQCFFHTEADCIQMGSRDLRDMKITTESGRLDDGGFSRVLREPKRMRSTFGRRFPRMSSEILTELIPRPNYSSLLLTTSSLLPMRVKALADDPHPGFRRTAIHYSHHLLVDLEGRGDHLLGDIQ